MICRSPLFTKSNNRFFKMCLYGVSEVSLKILARLRRNSLIRVYIDMARPATVMTFSKLRSLGDYA